jgi:hypothetical protein
MVKETNLLSLPTLTPQAPENEGPIRDVIHFTNPNGQKVILRPVEILQAKNVRGDLEKDTSDYFVADRALRFCAASGVDTNLVATSLRDGHNYELEKYESVEPFKVGSNDKVGEAVSSPDVLMAYRLEEYNPKQIEGIKDSAIIVQRTQTIISRDPGDVQAVKMTVVSREKEEQQPEQINTVGKMEQVASPTEPQSNNDLTNNPYLGVVSEIKKAA